MNKSTNWNYAVILIVLAAVSVFSQTPAPYTARLQPFLTGLSRPILIRSSPDNTKRLFIVRKGWRYPAIACTSPTLKTT